MIENGRTTFREIWRRLHSDTAPPAGAPTQPAAKPAAAPAPSATAPFRDTADRGDQAGNGRRKCLPPKSPAVRSPRRRRLRRPLPACPRLSLAIASKPSATGMPTVSVPAATPVDRGTGSRDGAGRGATPIDEYASKTKTVFREVWRRIHQEDAVIAGKPEDRKELGR